VVAIVATIEYNFNPKWAKIYMRRKEMLTLEKIKSELADRQPGKVAKATGLHYNTIRKVRDNPDANPSYRVIVALSEYLENGAVAKNHD